MGDLKDSLNFVPRKRGKLYRRQLSLELFYFIYLQSIEGFVAIDHCTNISESLNGPS